MANAAKDGDTVIIKKYANRRLYNTRTSSYITLDHLAQMVKENIEFKVLDAKTGALKWRVPQSTSTVSAGVLAYDSSTVFGTIVAGAGGSDWRMYYARNPATGAQISIPSELPISYGLTPGLIPGIGAQVLDNGGVLIGNIEYGNGTVRWQMPAGSSQSLVGVAGSGRVIYEGG
jgi:outer membrane protein assembly factor BamB